MKNASLRNCTHKLAHLRSERGQSLLEAAIAVVMLFLLVAGAVEFGGIMQTHIILANASREGARYGARFPYHYSGIRNAAKAETAGTTVTLANSDIQIVPEPTPAASGDPITVTVTFQYQTLTGGLIGFNTINLSTDTQMRVFDVTP